MSSVFAILMAGGSGTRFWPASRRDRPKQLLPIGRDVPLLLETSERLRALVPPERQIVVTSARYVDAVRNLLPDVPAEQVLGEPVGRDTAPCIGLAARLVDRLDSDATAVAMPSDHIIQPEETFLDHLRAAERALEDNAASVLVFGIEPDRPATGYGYLRRGDPVGDFAGKTVYELGAFVEKPDLARAEEMVSQGGYAWNAGLFAFRPAALAAAYDAHLPGMNAELDRIVGAWGTAAWEDVLTGVFPQLEAVSIDYGVMEKLDGCLMLPLAVDWDDVGAWSALERLRTADEAGNVHDGVTLVVDGRDNLLAATDGGLVAVKGVDGLIVVHTPDATLVCRRDDDQGVKAIVQALAERGLDRYL